MSDPFFTIITPTYNRGALLDTFLESISAQILDPALFRVIVVDNNSTDDTAARLAQFKSRMPQFSSIFEPKQGTSNAKNAAVEKTQSEYLVFFDDDVIVPPTHLFNAYQIIQQYCPDIMAGPIYPYFTVVKPRWFREETEIKKSQQTSGFFRLTQLNGANWIIKRKVFLKMGGFDPNLGPRGAELTIYGDERKLLETYYHSTSRENQKVYYALECPVQHYIDPQKMQMGYIIRRNFLSGRSMAIIHDELTPNSFSKRKLWDWTWNIPASMVRKIRSDSRIHGWKNADYVGAVKMSCYQLGYLYEQLTRKIKRRIALLAR